MQEVRDLQVQLSDVSIQEDQNDVWTYERGNKFSAALYYRFFFKDFEPHPSFKWIWKAKNTFKLKFFCWLLLSDRVNTRDMLRRRHYNINSGLSCVLCSNPPVETMEHLFFQCCFSKECWELLGIHWNNNGNHLDWIAQAKQTWNKCMFMEIFMVGAWSIWKERNALIFEGIAPTIASWKLRFKKDFEILVHRTKPELHTFIHTFVNSF